MSLVAALLLLVSLPGAPARAADAVTCRDPRLDASHPGHAGRRLLQCRRHPLCSRPESRPTPNPAPVTGRPRTLWCRPEALHGAAPGQAFHPIAVEDEGQHLHVAVAGDQALGGKTG